VSDAIWRSDGMKWATTLAAGADFDEAFTGAIARLVGHLGGLEPDLLLVFVTPGYGNEYHRIPGVLRAAFPNAAIAGCAAGGVVGGGRELERVPALALVGAVLPDVEVRAFHIDGADLPGRDADVGDWHRLVGLEPVGDPLFLLFADAFTTDIDALLGGLDEAFPKAVKVGGLASGAAAPGLNVLFVNDTVHHMGCAAVTLRGEIVVDTVVAQGCRPIGSPMFVTRCEVNLIHEFDGRPAPDALVKLFQSLSQEDKRLFRTSLCLGLALDPDPTVVRHGDFLIRNLIGVDPSRGIVAVGSEIQPQQVVQFHLHDAEASAMDLRTMLQRQLDTAGDSAAPAVALLFSCLGRGKGLYGIPDHDSGMIVEHLGDLPIGGFFCGGEIGPVHGKTRVHGYTSSIALLRAP
jgi:small ligand-binding sensory domain FIST